MLAKRIIAIDFGLSHLPSDTTNEDDLETLKYEIDRRGGKLQQELVFLGSGLVFRNGVQVQGALRICDRDPVY